MLRRLEGWLNKLCAPAHRQPKLVLAFCLITILVSIPGILKIKTLISLDELIEPKLASSLRNQQLKENYPGGPNLLLFFSKDSKFSGKDLCQIRAWSAQVQQTTSNFERIHSPFELRRYLSHQNRAWYPPLISLPCDDPGHDFDLSYFQKSPWAGILADLEFKNFIINFEFKRNEMVRTEALEISQQANVLAATIGASVHHSGTLSFENSMLEGLKQMSGLNILVLIVIFAGLTFFVGTWKAPLLYSLTLLFCAILTHGLMGFLNAPVDMISNSLFLMIAVASLEDFVFLCQRFIQCRDWDLAFKEQRLPSLLTSMTTIIGFWSLCVSDLSIIARFGFWAGTAALLEWISVFVLLPAVIKSWPKLGELSGRNDFRGQRILGQISEWKVPYWASKIALLVFASFPLLLSGRSSLDVRDDPTEVFAKEHPFRRTAAELKKTFNWVGEVSLEIGSQLSEQRKSEILASVNKLTHVSKMEDFQSIFEDIAKDQNDPLVRQRIYRELRSSREMKRYFSKDALFDRSILYIKSMDSAENTLFKNSILRICPNGECQLAGTVDAYAEFASVVPKTLIESFSLTLLLVALTLTWIHFAVGAQRLFAWLVCNFWGPAFMLLVISIFQIKINFVTCIFVTILMGLTGDNAIQFLLARVNFSLGQRALDIAAKQEAAIVCSLMMSLGSLVFLFSYFEPPKTLGILLSLGIMSALFGDLWLLKRFTCVEDSSKH